MNTDMNPDTNNEVESYLVSHSGWFLFCPIYWSEQENCAVVRNVPWWLFDLALEVQQFRNWCLSWLGYEGGFPFRLKPIHPKVITTKQFLKLQ